MRFAIAYSKKDEAGINIVNKLKKISFLPHVPIIELKKETIISEDLNKKNYPRLKNIDFLIFASKHESEKKESSLCLHAPGNWRGAEFGGESGKICFTSAFIWKYLIQELNKNAKDLSGYKITLECTHHGPLIEIPCGFIEVGSNKEQWNDEKAIEIIARTIISLKNFKLNSKWIPCIGIGGPHYCPNFNKIQLNSNYAISHVIPSYIYPITESMLKQAEQKTKEQIKEVLIDWKSFNSHERQEVVNLLNKVSLNYKRTNEIIKTN